MPRPLYSIIIPAYNESQRISASLDRVLTYMEEQRWDAEIVVVDDGSRDETANIVRQYVERNPAVKLLQNPGNQGKGYSVRNGVLHAQGRVVMFTDADLSSPIGEAAKLFSAIADGADMAIGSRWLQSELQTERQPVYRQFFGRIFNLLLRAVLGLRFKDTQCGFKAFTAEVAQILFSRQKIRRWAFDPELLFLANKLGYTVREVPVAWAHDTRTKISPLKDGLRMLVEVLKIRWYDLTGRYAGGVRACAAPQT